MDFSLNKLTIKKIYAVNSINNLQCKKNIHRKGRNFYALAYKFSGHTVYKSQEGSYVSDNEHVILLPKNVPYSYQIEETGPCIMIEFDSDDIIDRFYSYPLAYPTEIEKLFKHLARIWTTKNDGYELSALSDTYSILYKMFVNGNTSYAIKHCKEILTPAILYIRENYNDNTISNEQLSKLSGISVIYFRKLFSQLLHVSPMKYIHNIRMEKAKEMLLGDYTSISDIAEELGFSSIYSFSRTFKKATGFSPTDYHKGEPSN